MFRIVSFLSLVVLTGIIIACGKGVPENCVKYASKYGNSEKPDREVIHKYDLEKNSFNTYVGDELKTETRFKSFEDFKKEKTTFGVLTRLSRTNYIGSSKFVFTYNYDSNNRLTGMIATGDGKEEPVSKVIKWDSKGRGTQEERLGKRVDKVETMYNEDKRTITLVSYKDNKVVSKTVTYFDKNFHLAKRERLDPQGKVLQTRNYTVKEYKTVCSK